MRLARLEEEEKATVSLRGINHLLQTQEEIDLEEATGLETPDGKGDELPVVEGALVGPGEDRGKGEESFLDPFRIYARDIASRPLVTREAEMALGKMKEEGEREIRRAISRTPLAVQQVFVLAERLQEGKERIERVVRGLDDEACPEEEKGRCRQRFLEIARQLKGLRWTSREKISQLLEELDLKRGWIDPVVQGLREQLLRAEREAAADDGRAEDRLIRFDTRVPSRGIQRGKGRQQVSKAREARKHALQVSISLAERREVMAAIERGETKAREAKGKLVEATLRLVIMVARQYTYRGVGFLDLIQEGNLGLMRAAEQYDYRKGHKFSTYAVWWVRHLITRALAEQVRTIRIPARLFEMNRRMGAVSLRLSRARGEKPSLEEIAREMKMTAEEVCEIMRIGEETISLEMPIGEDDSRLADFIQDKKGLSPAEAAIRRDMTRQISRALATLTSREEQVIRMRFGIGEPSDYTLQEVGEMLGLSRERVRQIELLALEKLRHPARRKFLEYLNEES